MTEVDEQDEREVGYKSVLDFGREAKVYYPHNVGEYPTKILPHVARLLVRRFSRKGDTILDPFCGAGTFAIEAKIAGRNSINYDINPKAVELAKQRLALINPINGENNTTHIVEVHDSRTLPLPNESMDAVITDIPYANMIKYSDIPNDLSTIEDYSAFLAEIKRAFAEVWRVLKWDKYCVIFAGDCRIAAARKILPVHSDIIQIMRELGFTIFDIYVWRYYRSGGFRPFGVRPYQAMNIHSYILVFHKRRQDINKQNRPVRFRRRLIEKLKKNQATASEPRVHTRVLSPEPLGFSDGR
ncbi:MAG: DNA methyltransferase [Candidatus Caldarchaeum sp.]